MPTPEERVRCHYRAGVQAARVLKGECADLAPPPPATRLSAEGPSEPALVADIGGLTAILRAAGTRGASTIWSGFPSQTEAEAFCLGAGLLRKARAWPFR